MVSAVVLGSSNPFPRKSPTLCSFVLLPIALVALMAVACGDGPKTTTDGPAATTVSPPPQPTGTSGSEPLTLTGCLRDGDTAMFRWNLEDIAELNRLQSELASEVGSWKVRRPNLNDVFLWVAGGKALKS